jgi:hypothetical protein
MAFESQSNESGQRIAIALEHPRVFVRRRSLPVNDSRALIIKSVSDSPHQHSEYLKF